MSAPARESPLQVPPASRHSGARNTLAPSPPELSHLASHFHTLRRNSLNVNFHGIWAAFGDIAGGGCPACYQNAVDFWCAATCSPLQADYMNFTGLQENTTDPVGGGVYTVAAINASLNVDYASAVFGSCNATGKVKEFTPLQSMEGFFKYQGQTEAIFTGLSFFNFTYTPAGAVLPALTYPSYSCTNFPEDITPSGGYIPNATNTSCPCTSCFAEC